MRMDRRKNKQLFTLIIVIATIILIAVGSTFAYFTATISSEENAVSFGAAVFTMDLEDDTSLLKTQLIPSAEKYVDASTIQRLDENGEFIKPYRENEQFVYEETACIDDNLNEICSIYSFTVINTMTDMDLPLYITLIPTINTFENLYFKVVDEDKNVVMERTPVKNETTDSTANNEDNENNNNNQNAVVLTGIKDLPKATKEEATDEIIPSKAKYSIILWILETGDNQTAKDGGQIFAATLNVMAGGPDGGGITGVFSAGGTE